MTLDDSDHMDVRDNSGKIVAALSIVDGELEVRVADREGILATTFRQGAL